MMIFEEKIHTSNVNLKCLNLIIGTTGAGKSALFNYLNEIPLMITKKKIKNKQNKLVESSEPILIVNEQKLMQNNHSTFAPISSGYTSETTIPNFCQSKTGNVAYVDCAG